MHPPHPSDSEQSMRVFAVQSECAELPSGTHSLPEEEAPQLHAFIA